MSNAALINVKISVTATGADIDRQTLATTIGAWVDLLPKECREIHTENKDGERVLIVVHGATEAS